MYIFPKGFPSKPPFSSTAWEPSDGRVPQFGKCRGIFRIYFPRGNNFTFNLNSFKYQMSHSLPFHSFNFANFFLFWGPREQTDIFQQFHECFIIRMEKVVKKSTRKYFFTEKWRKDAEFGNVLGSIPASSGSVESEGPIDAAVLTTVLKI